MSTSSMIAQDLGNGTVRAIYCHWDGYREETGRILQDHYTSAGKVAALMDLGSLSTLQREIGQKHDFDQAQKEYPDWCLAYHQDRGERMEQPMNLPIAKAVRLLHMARRRWGVQFVYLFQNGAWSCAEFQGGAWGDFTAL